MAAMPNSSVAKMAQNNLLDSKTPPSEVMVSTRASKPKHFDTQRLLAEQRSVCMRSAVGTGTAGRAHRHP